MKDLIQPQFRNLLAIAGTAALVTFAGASSLQAANLETDVAIMPGADIVLRMDLDALHSSTMYEQLKELSEKKTSAEENKLKDLNRFNQTLTEATGLSKDDLGKLTIAAELDSVPLNSKKSIFARKDLNLAIAFALDKPVTLAQVKEIFRKTAEENGKTDQLSFGEASYKGTPILTMTDASDGEPQTLMVAMASDNKMLLGGTEKGLKQALDRSASGTTVIANDLFEKDIMQGIGSQPVTLIFAPTGAMSKQLAEQAQEAADMPQQNARTAAAQAASSLRGIRLAVEMQDQIDVELAGLLGSGADAQKIKTLLDNQVLGMARMMVMMMAQGQPLPLLQSIQTERLDAGLVTLRFTLTKEDVSVLKKAMEKQSGTSSSQRGPAD